MCRAAFVAARVKIWLLIDFKSIKVEIQLTVVRYIFRHAFLSKHIKITYHIYKTKTFASLSMEYITSAVYRSGI